MSRRILHVINGELYSGAERVQDLLSLRLRDLGYEVGFACIKPGRFPERRMDKQSPLHLVPMASRYDLGCGVRLARIIRREGYTLVHTHTPRAALVGRIASLLAGVPMMHHVHSPTSRDTENALRNRINALMEKFSLSGVSRLLPVSRSLGEYLREDGWPTQKISIVANGVPTPGPLPDRRPPSDGWVIGTVALFRPRKGMEVLIEALAILKREGRKIRLRAVGPFETPEYQQSILALAQRLGVSGLIEWTGFTSDVNAEFACMDAFVLPSLFGEGMPMVILEAMAMGVPTVASDVEGIPEVLDHGRSGLVVPAGNAPRLAEALGELMDGRHDWEGLRAAAYDTQRDHFSDRSMAAGVACAYREVLNHA